MVRAGRHALPAPAGHALLCFPPRARAPGVVLLDLALEAAAVLLGREPKVAQLAHAKFLMPLLPGQDARVELSHEHATLDFRVLRGEDTVLAQGRFLLREGSRP